MRPLGLDTVRKQASAIEVETRRFYERAAARAQDASIRQLLDDLAQEERSHEDRAQELHVDKNDNRDLIAIIIPKRAAWIGHRSVIQSSVTEKLNTRHPEPVCNLPFSFSQLWRNL